MKKMIILYKLSSRIGLKSLKGSEGERIVMCPASEVNTKKNGKLNK